MDSSLMKTVGLTAITAMITVFVARADGAPATGQASGTLAADSAAVRRDSVVEPRWISNENIFALVATMNARQIAAADIELSAWRSDTVRALAAGLAREHAELQRSADSLANALHIPAVPSALSTEVNAAFQAQIDSMLGSNRGASLDRAFVKQQVASHQMMDDYLAQLAGVATRPELSAWLESARGRVGTQLTRVKGQQLAFVVADSILADSLAKRTATRRGRQTPNR